MSNVIHTTEARFAGLLNHVDGKADSADAKSTSATQMSSEALAVASAAKEISTAAKEKAEWVWNVWQGGLLKGSDGNSVKFSVKEKTSGETGKTLGHYVTIREVTPGGSTVDENTFFVSDGTAVYSCEGTITENTKKNRYTITLVSISPSGVKETFNAVIPNETSISEAIESASAANAKSESALANAATANDKAQSAEDWACRANELAENAFNSATAAHEHCDSLETTKQNILSAGENITIDTDLDIIKSARDYDFASSTGEVNNIEANYVTYIRPDLCETEGGITINIADSSVGYVVRDCVLYLDCSKCTDDPTVTWGFTPLVDTSGSAWSVLGVPDAGKRYIYTFTEIEENAFLASRKEVG